MCALKKIQEKRLEYNNKKAVSRANNTAHELPLYTSQDQHMQRVILF